jgi:hypothetical protein
MCDCLRLRNLHRGAHFARAATTVLPACQRANPTSGTVWTAFGRRYRT